MKLLFIGVEYFSGEAYLIFDDVFGNGARIRQSLANHQISFARKASRFCSGWYDLRGLLSNPCSQKNRVLGDSPRCADCENRTGYNPFFYNTSRVSDAQRSYNAEPHIVYLASFAPDTIKVGITNARRKLNRWLDQGAIYVRELALLENAEDARSMEKFISSTIQVPEAISYKKKLSLFIKNGCGYYPDEVLQSVVMSIRKKYPLAGSADVTVSLESYYVYDKFEPEGLLDISGTVPLSFSGRCVALVGNLCIVTNDERYFSCNLNRFKSHIVDFSRGSFPMWRDSLF